MCPGVARRSLWRHLAALLFLGFYQYFELPLFSLNRKSSKITHFIALFFGVSLTMLKWRESVHFINHFTLRILTYTRHGFAMLGVFEKVKIKWLVELYLHPFSTDKISWYKMLSIHHIGPVYSSYSRPNQVIS